MEQEAPYEIPDQDPKDWPPYGEVKFDYMISMYLLIFFRQINTNLQIFEINYSLIFREIR